jgi:hypothetical protein
MRVGVKRRCIVGKGAVVRENRINYGEICCLLIKYVVL